MLIAYVNGKLYISHMWKIKSLLISIKCFHNSQVRSESRAKFYLPILISVIKYISTEWSLRMQILLKNLMYTFLSFLAFLIFFNSIIIF